MRKFKIMSYDGTWVLAHVYADTIAQAREYAKQAGYEARRVVR
jgi:hypothetical protein